MKSLREKYVQSYIDADEPYNLTTNVEVRNLVCHYFYKALKDFNWDRAFESDIIGYHFGTTSTATSRGDYAEISIKLWNVIYHHVMDTLKLFTDIEIFRLTHHDVMEMLVNEKIIAAYKDYGDSNKESEIFLYVDGPMNRDPFVVLASAKPAETTGNENMCSDNDNISHQVLTCHNLSKNPEDLPTQKDKWSIEVIIEVVNKVDGSIAHMLAMYNFDERQWVIHETENTMPVNTDYFDIVAWAEIPNFYVLRQSK